MTPRWFLALVAVLIVAATCVALGLWQLDRLEQRRAQNALLARRLGRAPVPLEELALAGTEPDPGAIAYRRVWISGTYDVGGEVVLFGRTLNGRPGNHVLTPIVTADGRGLIVDRGWVPIELDAPPVAEARPPAGQVTLTGVLFPSEEDGVAERGQVTSIGAIDLARIQRDLPYEIPPVYLWLRAQAPAQPGPLPERLSLPARSEGPHLSYALQWFIFATIALVGFGALARKEARRQGRSAEPG